jgi:hypothetical protein
MFFFIELHPRLALQQTNNFPKYFFNKSITPPVIFILTSAAAEKKITIITTPLLLMQATIKHYNDGQRR